MCHQNQTGKDWEKKIKTMYCLGRKNSHNFKLEEVKVRNKVLRVILNCVGGRTTQSTFLKKIHNNRY